MRAAPVISLVLTSLVVASPGRSQLPDRHLFTITGEREEHFLGIDVRGAGDVNGDGHDDVIIGSAVAKAAGKGFAILVSGSDGRVLRRFEGNSPGDGFGRAVSGGGDVDRDGHADVAIGAPGGRWAAVYSGRTGARLQLKAAAASEPFGGQLDFVGDVNADGHDDWVVATNGGAVFSGKDGRQLYRLAGLPPFRRAGDVDRDGHADVIAGGNGRATVYSGRDGSVLHELRASEAGFGSAVSAAGDVDRDGRGDLIVGAPLASNGSGLARVYSGRTGAVLFTLTHSNGLTLGASVDGAGDTNDDGFPDLLIGTGGYPSQNAVYLFSGRDAKILTILAPHVRSDGYGVCSGAGDVNRDGRADLVVGAPGHDRTDHGRAFVYSGTGLPLFSDVHEVSLTARGKQRLSIEAGRIHFHKTYWVLGSLSGRWPGLRLGAVTLPLVPDQYFSFCLAVPNSPILPASLGRLDSAGRAATEFVAVAGLPADLAGAVLHHAYVLFGTGGIVFASNATPLRLVR